MNSDLEKASNEKDVSNDRIDYGVKNGSFPSQLYQEIPCLIGYSYLRLMVDGNLLPCCVARHEIGDVNVMDWRQIWHSGAFENFRKKTSRIHIDKFHLTDPEWTFCQQCSHIPINTRSYELIKKE
jgi:hypothetical protein